MLYDIEINEHELRELCKHYDLKYPTAGIAQQDSLYTKLDVDCDADYDYLYYLQRDNIAIWADGELL